MRFLAGILFVGAVAACNALTGAGDLSVADECVACEPGSSSGTSGSSGSSGAGEGGVDAEADVRPPGSPGLDGTFGTGGVVVSDLLDVVTSVALRKDGKLAVAGSFSNQLAVVQLTASGALDTAFGTGGRVMLGSLGPSRADAVMIDASDRVVAGGVATSTSGGGVPTSIGIVMRIAGGKSDSSFGFAGHKTLDQGDAVSAIVPNALIGGYIAVGHAANMTSTTVGALWALTSNGGYFDTSAPRTDISFSATSPSTLVAAAGDLSSPVVVAGTVTAVAVPGTTSSDFAVARVTSGGLDKTFNGDGKVVVTVTDQTDTAFAMARGSSGASVVGGEVVVKNGTPDRSPQVGIVRIDSTGDADLTWGFAGKVITAFAPPGDLTPGLSDHLRGLAVDSLGRVIVVGYIEEVLTKSKRRPALLRLGPNGTKDVFFGTFGLFTDFFDKASTDSAAVAVAIQPDGKIVVAGTSSGKLAVARFVP